MSATATAAAPARNARTVETRVEEMGVFESVPALPFLVAMLVGEVHTRLPRPLGRLLCHELHRVLPAGYARELTTTLQGRPRDPQTRARTARTASHVTRIT